MGKKRAPSAPQTTAGHPALLFREIKSEARDGILEAGSEDVESAPLRSCPAGALQTGPNSDYVLPLGGSEGGVKRASIFAELETSVAATCPAICAALNPRPTVSPDDCTLLAT
jgi:hypothetical protein